MPALGACLGGEGRRHLQEFCAPPIELVAQLTDGFSVALLQQGTVALSLCCHVLARGFDRAPGGSGEGTQAQVLDDNQAVVFGQFGRHLVPAVIHPVGYPSPQNQKFAPSSGIAARSCDRAGKPTGEHAKTPLLELCCHRHLNQPAIGYCNRHLYSPVNPDWASGFHGEFAAFLLYLNGHVPVETVEPHSGILDCAFNPSGKPSLHPAELGQPDAATVDLNPLGPSDSGRRPSTTFMYRVARLACEKVHEGLVQITQCLLE